MIEQLQTNPPDGLIAWVAGIAVAGFGALFGFIKWLVGIQVKKIDKLSDEIKDVKEELSAVKLEIRENTTYDKGAKAEMIRVQEDIKEIKLKIDNHFTTKFKDMQKQINELKAVRGL